jgi:hypothetical protein
MPKHIYKVIFADGSPDFLGGESIHSSLWLEIPDKPIKRLEYFFVPGEGLILEGFESYLCFVEAETTIARPVGNCPKCGSKGKISKKITKYTNDQIKQELIARCTKCDWIGNIQDLKHLVSVGSDKYIYIMGLKKGLVTSYRVALNGKDGSDKYQIGDITKRILPLGQEYRNRETNMALWKKGI